MSNKKRRNQIKASTKINLPSITENQSKTTAVSDVHGSDQLSEDQPSKVANVVSYIRTHVLMIGVICLLVFGALGSALKYLDEDARREIAKRNSNNGDFNKEDQSFLNKINPFLPAAKLTPTPQLSKEYIYAGSRMLAVEDSNANAAALGDLAVWRPSTGVWYVLGGPGSQQTYQSWGLSGDDPVEGDYDGDGKTDFAVYRKLSGQASQWWIMKSSDGSYYQVNFGAYDDKPAPGDFDGDGRTDVAVYRPSAGAWYIMQSSTGTLTTAQFGLSTDIPAPADFDGDGRADVGVWRNSNTTYYALGSSNGVLYSPNLGQSSAEPVSADYDGDGKANFAIKSGNNWVILNSAFTQTQTTVWEQAGDIPVPNDYDGDGKVDIAVWRNANGTWYIKNSTDNSTRTAQWGAPGDIPVPAYFRR